MAFGSFKHPAAVLRAYDISYQDLEFVEPRPIAVDEFFRAELSLVVRENVTDNSEAAICENLIFPTLKEVWKVYRQDFLLWSHQSLVYDEMLAGIPDYILARRSPLGRIVFDRPYCLLVEAKQDNFQEGWGQCLAAMVAAWKLNHEAGGEGLGEVFGIVSNGDRWEFGRLRDRQFTKNIRNYSLQDLELLLGALNDLFGRCQAQLAVA